MKFFFTEKTTISKFWLLRMLPKKVGSILRILFCLFVRGGGGGGEHAQKPKFGDGRFFSEKKLHKALRARFNFSRLSLAFILKYYPILHAVKR